MAKKLPKPYKRPSIEIGGHGKSWQSLKASEVEAGDLVMGHGQVNDTATQGKHTSLKFLSKAVIVYTNDETLQVFTHARNVGG